MPTHQPPQAAAEEATAELLREAIIEIRFLSAPTMHQSPKELVRGRDRIHELADLCHNLPGLLAPERRPRLTEGLRHMWRTSSARKRMWVRACWDHLGYDYSWLTHGEISGGEQPPRPGGPDPASGG
jgi:hypothetical protein